MLVRFLLGFAVVFSSLFLIALVLIQRGRGGGLAGALGGMGGQSAFGTKAGDVFTRITVGAASCWILLCILALNVLGPRDDGLLDPGKLGTVNAVAPQIKPDDKADAKPEGEAAEAGTTPPATKAGESAAPDAGGVTSDASAPPAAESAPPAGDGRPAAAAGGVTSPAPPAAETPAADPASPAPAN